MSLSNVSKLFATLSSAGDVKLSKCMIRIEPKDRKREGGMHRKLDVVPGPLLRGFFLSSVERHSACARRGL
jgi:hypothetical protein